MSTDYDVYCTTCKKTCHLGQSSGGTSGTFGHGTNDEEGRNRVMDFIVDHLHFDCRVGVNVSEAKEIEDFAPIGIGGSEKAWQAERARMEAFYWERMKARNEARGL